MTVTALRQCLEAARLHQCPFLHLGDLLHTKAGVPTEVIDPLLALFREFMDVPTFLLVGNHERPDKYSSACNLGWLDKLHPNLVVIREVCMTEIRGVDCYWLPWTADCATTVWDLNRTMSERAAAHPTNPRVMLGHGCVDGSLADNGTRLSNPSMTPESLGLGSYNLALFGDIHKRQQFAPNGWYCGALHQNRAGEDDNEDGYVLVADDLTLTWQILTGVPRFGKTAIPNAVGHVEVVDRPGETMYLRPDEAAVIEALEAAMPTVRMSLNLSDMQEMVTKYAAMYPPPDGVTLPEVLTAVAGATNA